MKGCAPAIAALLLCAGCLSSSTPAPKTWIVSPPDVAPPVAPSPGAFAVTRQGALTVTAPFDSTSFVVRRADGSVARDPYNVFASPPSALLRASVRARLEADGRFGRVVPQSSSAFADVQAEVLVRDLSLGGIWDSQLEVWWTPRMRNGSLTYEATTNVNLNAGN